MFEIIFFKGEVPIFGTFPRKKFNVFVYFLLPLKEKITLAILKSFFHLKILILFVSAAVHTPNFPILWERKNKNKGGM